MLKIKEAIIVEGRYDKNTLSQVVDALILETGGFQVFKQPEKAALFRRVAAERGLIVLTDSDGAGFLIRNHLKGILPPEQVKQAYIPDLPGRERRKRRPGKEGKLGVEGMRPEVLEAALRRAGATILDEDAPAEADRTPVTKADFYAWGLTGGTDSAARRKELLGRLDLPEHLTAKAFLEVVNILYTRENFEHFIVEMWKNGC